MELPDSRETASAGARQRQRPLPAAPGWTALNALQSDGLTTAGSSTHASFKASAEQTAMSRPHQSLTPPDILFSSYLKLFS